jgi:predicted TIM-barrel fold metal-dependent hydrolase
LVPRPRDIPAIDTLIGFRDTHQMGVASTKGDWQRHPAEYMFKDEVWPKFLYDNAAKLLKLPART